MKKLTLFTAVAFAASLVVTSAALAKTSKGADDFVKHASVANTFEISSSNIALQKSQNADVKKFAQKMIDDHTKAGDDLKATLPKSGADASVMTDKLDDAHQAIIDKLNGASGNDFDRQYIAAQTDAHKEAVSLFKDYSTKGDDKALKDFAARTLPTLEKHLEHVKMLKAGS